MRPAPLLPVSLLALAVAAFAGCIKNDTPAPSSMDGSNTPSPPGPYLGFLPPEGNLTDPSSVPLPVNYLVTPTRGPANELSIAVNPTDPNNLVAGGKDYFLGTDHPCDANYPFNVWTGVYWSKDGGKTWLNSLMPGHPEDGANATSPNRVWPCNSDPVVVFGEDGIAYFSGLGIRGSDTPNPMHPCVLTGSGIWLMKSADGGETWTDFSCVASGASAPAGGGVGVDKQWFAVDGSNVYFTYMAFNPTSLDLKFRRSTDRGETWGGEITLFEFPSASDPDAAQGGRQFSTPAVDEAGNLYVTWRNFGAGIYFTRSINNGVSFEPSRTIAPVNSIGQLFDGGYRLSSYPVLAADPSQTGQLYVAWADNAEGDADIVFIKSEDGGATWTTPARLNNDAPGNGAQQFLPWITAGPTGDVHVGWLDNRSYGNATRLDFYFRTSADGGETWSPELRVNAAPIETESCHHQSGANFIGDYLGLAASEKAVHPFWPDGAAGRCNGMTATLPR